MHYTKVAQNFNDFYFTTATPFTSSLAPSAFWVSVVFKDHSVLLLSV